MSEQALSYPGDPRRFNINDEGIDISSSLGLCIERARAQVDLLNAYFRGLAESGDVPTDLLASTVPAMLYAIDYELGDMRALTVKLPVERQPIHRPGEEATQ